MKKLIVAAAIASLSGTALAAGAFDGPQIQLGIGGSATWAKTTGENSSGPVTVDGNSSSGSVNGIVAAGYSKEIDGTGGFNLASNIFYVIGNQNAGSTGGNSTLISKTGTSELKGTFGISVEPGWNFSKETLGYVKLAWLNSRYNWSNTETDTGVTASSSLQGSINGFGYGLGVKQMLTDNIYAGIDLMGVTYGSYNPGGNAAGLSFKANQFMGFASIGYKF
jgi:opacity protein-like surface antigen